MAIHSQDLLAIERLAIAPVYARPGETQGIPKDALPPEGLDPRVVYRLLHDELMLDGNSRLNLATFVTTLMDEEADRLLAETLDKNMIDKDEYPQTAAIEARCVRMLADLWNSPSHEQATGTSTTGSSEAVMLGGLALKWRWRQRREAAGLPTDRPNLVMGINVQVVWEKFCRYWDVEPRYVPIEEGRLQLIGRGGPEARRREHHRRGGDPGLDLRRLLRAGQGDRPTRSTPWPPRAGRTSRCTSTAPPAGSSRRSSTPTWSGTSGCPRVRSINASGHKYGLVYPGVGWVVWRTPRTCPRT